jgi:hypothetical protein
MGFLCKKVVFYKHKCLWGSCSYLKARLGMYLSGMLLAGGKICYLMLKSRTNFITDWAISQQLLTK